MSRTTLNDLSIETTLSDRQAASILGAGHYCHHHACYPSYGFNYYVPQYYAYPYAYPTYGYSYGYGYGCGW